MLKLAVTLLVLCAVVFISNTSGFLFSKTAKCEIAVYKGGKDFSGEKIMANKSFVPYLKAIGTVAKGCKVKIHVTDSYKQLKTPNEFVLSSKLPLTVGRGIQFDIVDPKGGAVCNKLCMVSRAWKTIPEANCFINGIQKRGLKFTEPNQLDDGFVAKLSSADADKLKEAAQKLCAPKVKPAKG